jgi:serpin B
MVASSTFAPSRLVSELRRFSAAGPVTIVTRSAKREARNAKRETRANLAGTDPAYADRRFAAFDSAHPQQSVLKIVTTMSVPARACLLATLTTACASCSHAPPAPVDVAASPLSRNVAPTVSDADRAELVGGNTAFALDLYRNLRESDPAANHFVSPYSASIVLAMTYAGARGATADEMARVLHFTLPPDRLHAAFDAIDVALTRSAAPPPNSTERLELQIVDSLWSDRAIKLEAPFLDTLAVDYGAGVRLVDFATNASGARDAINQWVSENTHDKIDRIVGPESVDESTRLVLANAVYFRAPWQQPFHIELTSTAPFAALDGGTPWVPFMFGDPELLYAEGDGWQAIRLPYANGEASMLVVLPAPGAFAAFESTLDVARLSSIVAAMHREKVAVTLPKLDIAPDALDLVPRLRALGMTSVFDAGRADLSGMTKTTPLYVHAVRQKTFLHVDEKGTEAAAATASSGELISGPTKALHADHPFFFVIRDEATGTLLFVGRVVDPSR